MTISYEKENSNSFIFSASLLTRPSIRGILGNLQGTLENLEEPSGKLEGTLGNLEIDEAPAEDMPYYRLCLSG